MASGREDFSSSTFFLGYNDFFYFIFFFFFFSVQTISPEAALYETCYVTAHKAACRAGVFHPNGQLIATGSEDASIKVGQNCFLNNLL